MTQYRDASAGRGVTMVLYGIRKQRSGEAFNYVSGLGPIVRGALRAKRTGDACKHDRKNARHENAVEGSRSADRSDRRAQPPDVAEIHEIGADQRAEAAAH